MKDEDIEFVASEFKRVWSFSRKQKHGIGEGEYGCAARLTLHAGKYELIDDFSKEEPLVLITFSEGIDEASALRVSAEILKEQFIKDRGVW